MPGNHEYHTPHAGPYWAYFCGTAGPTFEGWYSFDIGAWHPILGPSLALAHAFGRVVVGAEAEAFFLPTWVASPSFGYLGFVGVAL